MMMIKLFLFLSLLSNAVAFAPCSPTCCNSQTTTTTVVVGMSAEGSSSLNDATTAADSRRNFFAKSATLLGGIVSAATATGTTALPLPASAATPGKVLVLGGTGFVGSHVVSTLQGMGISVVATSRDGRDSTVALDFTKESGESVQQTIKALAKDCSAVISCIGVIGTPDDNAVNSGTGFAAMGAKEAGVDRFVYISVAPEVKEVAKNIDFLKGYMAGKSFSQDSIVSKFSPQQYTLIEPTFIYGGDEFKVNPPRVAGFYGSFVEGVLSSGPLRALTNVAPEGFIKIALEPPVSVEAVAKAAVAGALGY